MRNDLYGPALPRFHIASTDNGWLFGLKIPHSLGFCGCTIFWFSSLLLHFHFSCSSSSDLLWVFIFQLQPVLMPVTPHLPYFLRDLGSPLPPGRLHLMAFQIELIQYGSSPLLLCLNVLDTISPCQIGDGVSPQVHPLDFSSWALLESHAGPAYPTYSKSPSSLLPLFFIAYYAFHADSCPNPEHTQEQLSPAPLSLCHRA